MGNEADKLFAIVVGMTFGVLEEHEPLIISLFIPIVSRSSWIGPWNIIGSELDSGTFKALDIYYKRVWEGLGHPLLGGGMQKV